MRILGAMFAAAALALPTASFAETADKLEVQHAGTYFKEPNPTIAVNGGRGGVLETPFHGRTDVLFKGGIENFSVGARTVWHTHPLGQILLVTKGCGIVQSEGQPPVVVRPGDVVWIPPNVRHWHGGTPSSAMSHYVTAEALNGKAIDLMEPVSDVQFKAADKASGGCGK